VSLVVALADYAASYAIDGDFALEAARQCLMGALGRGFEALRDSECASLLGPLVPGAVMPGGARVPGTSLELDPAQAAFCTALLLCRDAEGDEWPAPNGMRAADSLTAILAAILAVADYRARRATMEGESPPRVRAVLAAIVKAMEIQGVLAAQGAYSPTAVGSRRQAGVTATAIVTAQLGGTPQQILTALGYACIEGGAPNQADEPSHIGRRDWLTADAMSRAVRHACHAVAPGRSSYLDSMAGATADLTTRLLGWDSSTVREPFGTRIVDRLAGLREARDIEALASRFRAAVDGCFPLRQAERLRMLFAAPERLDELPVNELLAALVTNGAR
jgi:2-methylcitrate dehydratase